MGISPVSWTKWGSKAVLRANVMLRAQLPSKSLDKQRKSRRIFKHQKKLQLVRRANGKTKEKAEGLTYTSGIITDLSSLEDKIAVLLGNIQSKDVQEALDIASLPDPEPSMPTEKPPSDTEVFLFLFRDFKQVQRLCDRPTGGSLQDVFLWQIRRSKQINCFECNRSSSHNRRL